MSRKVYDCFTFFKEFELLKLRLEELWELVDYFVLVESPYAHSGDIKPLWFQENKKNFEQYSDKIIHIVHNEQHRGIEAEISQRNKIAEGLVSVKDTDIVIISDSDEIPNKVAIANYDKSHGLSKLSEHLSYYFMNVRSQQEWMYPTIAEWGEIKKCKSIDWARRGPGYPIRNGGWHFSYLGGWESIQTKIKSFSCLEYNCEPYNSKEYIKDCIETSGDLFKMGHQFKVVPIDNTFPKYVRDHIEHFKSIDLLNQKKLSRK